MQKIIITMSKPTNLISLNALSLWVVLGIPMLIFSCQQPSGNEIEMIAHQIKDNNCRIQMISQYVDDSWTSSIAELRRRLPETLPDQERENILNLKNADLIRMFESYKTFDDNVHSLVDSMEQVDYLWADSIRNLSLTNQNLEMKIDSLFSVMSDTKIEQELYQQVLDIKTAPCDDVKM